MWKYKGETVPKPQRIIYDYESKLQVEQVFDGWFKIVLPPRDAKDSTLDNDPIEISDIRFKYLTDANHEIEENSFPINRDYISYLNALHVKLNGESELTVTECEGKYYVALYILEKPDLCQRVSIEVFETKEKASKALETGDWTYANVIRHEKSYNWTTSLTLLKGDDYSFKICRKCKGKFDFAEFGEDTLFKSSAEGLNALSRHYNSVY